MHYNRNEELYSIEIKGYGYEKYHDKEDKKNKTGVKNIKKEHLH